MSGSHSSFPVGYIMRSTVRYEDRDELDVGIATVLSWKGRSGTGHHEGLKVGNSPLIKNRDRAPRNANNKL